MASAAPNSDTVSYTGGSSYYDNVAKFNPTTAVVIVVLIAGCFMLAFLSVVVRRCMRDHPTFPQLGMGLHESYNSKTRGLEKADVDALPLVHCSDLGEKDDRECPVCLTNFEPEETLRLLPTCKHVFHQECIDAWFETHSTCPLCRASLLGGKKEENSTPGVQQVMPDAPVASITEVSENGDSDNELHRGMSDVPLEDSRTSTGAAPQSGAMISREDERTSARGTLFRNSESFKGAARGAAAYENAAAAAVSASTKISSFRKPPLTPAPASIHRSSSISADLISLRNLLMGGDQNANPTDTPSGSSRWFTRARSFESASRNRAVQNEYSTEPSRDEWVTIDLETGKVTSEAQPSSSKGESSKGPAPERSWSDRFGLSTLKSFKGIAMLSRSSSDVSSRHASHLLI